MRILVDGDATPQREDIACIGKKYNVEVIVYMDYAHLVYSDEYTVKQCSVGSDSVDMMIISDVKENDLVITQDYGLSSLVLTKKAKVLHVNGTMIDESNIETLLMQRFVGAKLRKANKHIKGPKKRTKDIEDKFIESLEELIKQGVMYE